MRKVAPRSQLAFACSGIPTAGIIGNGLDYFLFFFYSQIIGLSASLTGLAIGIALTCGAVADPIVGYLSDHWQSRWGRRHPFMYASILPLTILYVLVWFPRPGAASQWVLFAYLLAVLILLRLSMTIFDVPVRTMVAELTHDYDERTRLASLPISVGWFTSSVMTIAMYAVWLNDAAEGTGGQTQITGYQQAALVGGVVTLAALLFCTVGLHPEIPHLQLKASDRTPGLRDMQRSFGLLWRNRSMRALLQYGLFAGIGLGITSALWIYQYSFFYGMASGQMSLLVIAELLASFAAAPVIRKYVVKGDKKIMAIRFLVAYVAISMIPPPLLIWRVLPERGSGDLLHLLLIYEFLDQVLAIVTASLIYSLYADITDDVRLRAGERLEGAIFACQTFMDKGATAIGGLIAGLLLTVIHYPTTAQNEPIPDEILTRLGMSYMASWAVLVAIGIWFISKYEITRAVADAEVHPG